MCARVCANVCAAVILQIKRGKKGEGIHGGVACEEVECSHTIVFILGLFLSQCRFALLHNGCHCGGTLCMCVLMHMHEGVCEGVCL